MTSKDCAERTHQQEDCPDFGQAGGSSRQAGEDLAGRKIDEDGEDPFAQLHPELTPEVRLNTDLKHVIRKNSGSHKNETADRHGGSHDPVTGKPEFVKTFFHDLFVKYAA